MSSPQPATANVIRMRLHREELQLALREGISLDQARSRLASYREHRQRLEVETIGAPVARIEWPLPAPIDEPAERPRMWWQRD